MQAMFLKPSRINLLIARCATRGERENQERPQILEKKGPDCVHVCVKFTI